uniref:hypothetical protein n=1 Tax=Thelohanellus kitauei TaxID=669202 RepID=UPI003002D148
MILHLLNTQMLKVISFILIYFCIKLFFTVLLVSYCFNYYFNYFLSVYLIFLEGVFFCTKLLVGSTSYILKNLVIPIPIISGLVKIGRFKFYRFFCYIFLRVKEFCIFFIYYLKYLVIILFILHLFFHFHTNLKKDKSKKQSCEVCDLNSLRCICGEVGDFNHLDFQKVSNEFLEESIFSLLVSKAKDEGVYFNNYCLLPDFNYVKDIHKKPYFYFVCLLNILYFILIFYYLDFSTLIEGVCSILYVSKGVTSGHLKKVMTIIGEFDTNSYCVEEFWGKMDPSYSKDAWAVFMGDMDYKSFSSKNYSIVDNRRKNKAQITTTDLVWYNNILVGDFFYVKGSRCFISWIYFYTYYSKVNLNSNILLECERNLNKKVCALPYPFIKGGLVFKSINIKVNTEFRGVSLHIFLKELLINKNFLRILGDKLNYNYKSFMVEERIMMSPDKKIIWSIASDPNYDKVNYNEEVVGTLKSFLDQLHTVIHGKHGDLVTYVRSSDLLKKKILSFKEFFIQTMLYHERVKEEVPLKGHSHPMELNRLKEIIKSKKSRGKWKDSSIHRVMYLYTIGKRFYPKLGKKGKKN